MPSCCGSCRWKSRRNSRWCRGSWLDIGHQTALPIRYGRPCETSRMFFPEYSHGALHGLIYRRVAQCITQTQFGGAESAVGSTLTLNGQPFQVIGVSAPGFYGVDVGSKFDVATPVCSAALFDGKNSRLDQRSYWWLSVMGRLKPGVSTEHATSRLGA